MDAGHEATVSGLVDDFDEGELHAFVFGMDRDLGCIRGASGSDGAR